MIHLLAAQVLDQVDQVDLDLLQFHLVCWWTTTRRPRWPSCATAFLTPEFGGAVSADGTFTDAANLQDLLLHLKDLQQILNLVAHLERMISLQIQVQLSSMKEEIC